MPSVRKDKSGCSKAVIKVWDMTRRSIGAEAAQMSKETEFTPKALFVLSVTLCGLFVSEALFDSWN
jgi:hypothetical protein